METPGDRTSTTVSETIDRELLLIREAIGLVAGGHSARVVVASLHFGQELLDPARRMASECGVRIVPLWTIDDAGTGVAVEALSHA